MVSLDTLGALSSCQTAQEWQSRLATLSMAFGFSRFFFGLVRNQEAPFEHAFICTNYPQAWREKYTAMRFHIIDPVVAHCFRNSVPLVWNDGTFAAARQEAFYAQACEHGLRSGVSFPMHGIAGEFGIVSFADSDDDAKFDFENLSALSLIRDFALESSLKFLSQQPAAPEPRVRLTPRELDCLYWVMRGKTSWETSKILFCSETTVNFHIANINKKLNVRTRQQAILKAVTLELIAPN